MDAILKTQVEKLANEIANQSVTLDDVNCLMRSLLKSTLERMLNTEMEVHLGRRDQPNAADSAVAVADAMAIAD